MNNTYDPKLVTVVWGAIIFSGFVDDGDAISVEYDEEHATKKVGLDGQVARAMNANRTGKCTVRLMATSITNDLLSAAAAQDNIDRSAVYPLIVKDLSNLTVVFAKDAWINKTPGPAFSKDIGVREWVLDCGQMDVFNSGNAG